MGLTHCSSPAVSTFTDMSSRTPNLPSPQHPSCFIEYFLSQTIRHESPSLSGSLYPLPFTPLQGLPASPIDRYLLRIPIASPPPHNNYNNNNKTKENRRTTPFQRLLLMLNASRCSTDPPRHHPRFQSASTAAYLRVRRAWRRHLRCRSMW